MSDPRQFDSSLTIRSVMTPSPHSIGADQSLALAAERMATLHVRHLPVLAGGELMGIVSERDIALVRSVVPEQLGEIPVEDAMTAVPYCVNPDERLSEVARHMALRKLGSAIVVEHGKLVGVFTTTDALQILAEMLGEQDLSDGDGTSGSVVPPQH